MKQIKTIVRDASKVEAFDKDVNEAIAAGWTLTKRDVWNPYSGLGIDYHRCLYAELEKNIITEAERCCDNCLHEPESPDVDPCFSCEECSNWRGAEV